MLTFSHVSYAYQSNSGTIEALKSVSLQLSKGEFLGLIGKNGSGKTTVVSLANGLTFPQEGSVVVEGVDTKTASVDELREIRSTVGVVFQDPETQIVASTVYEDVAFGPCNLGLPEAEVHQRVHEALATCGLAHLAARGPHTLSGGEKQRLALAGVLAMRPSFLVMDEPYSMLDPQARQDMKARIKGLVEQGIGVLLVTHDLSDIVACDKVVALVDGRISFEGSTHEFLAQRALVERAGSRYTPLMECASLLAAHAVGGVGVVGKHSKALGEVLAESAEELAQQVAGDA